MNRQQFNEWLVASSACSPAVEWCDQHPELSVHELIAICPRGEWILWLYAKAGYAPEVLAPVAYRAATRAIGYAADALDSAGVEHEMRGIVITDKESAVAGDEAAANAVVAARSAAYAEYSAASAAAFATAYAASAAKRADASKASAALAARAAADAAAEQKLCADDCRELLPVWEEGK